MPLIHVLDNQTIDQIAAGEVIERPVSVVKELVENALDAGATEISVEIRGGGIELIRVTDNGSGIPVEEVPTAFERHATSKIRDAGDLFALSSLGFRGEALSSIASVARVELITRRAEQLTGLRYCIEGGQVLANEEAAAPAGTTFYVRDLFFNTPVRRKFLKSAQTETSYVATLMEQLMLSRPGISMTLLADGRTKLKVNGSYSMKDVIYTLYGRETAGLMRPLNYEENGLRLFGYIGLPTLCRGNRNGELCFINGRFVKSALIMKAVEQAYHGLVMQHKFPVAILHLQMDPSLLDVNVHPTKMEVRFRSEKEVFGTVYRGIRECLYSRDLIPRDGGEAETQRENEPSREGAELSKEPDAAAADPRRKAVGPACESDSAPAGLSSRERTGLSREPEDKSGSDLSAPAFNSRIREDAGDYRVEADRRLLEQMLMAMPAQEKAAEEAPALREVPAAAAAAETEKAEIPPASPEVSSPAAADAEKPRQLELFEDKILQPGTEKRFRLIGQVFDTYWLMEYEDWFLLADQHAVHEKILYERTMKALEKQEQTSQLLDPPLLLTLTAAQQAALERYGESFRSLGFEIGALGGREYAVNALPDNLLSLSGRELFLELLDELGEGGARTARPRMLEARVAMMSCKAAVKGREHLSFAEAEALLKELLTLENPYTCPHGRPTLIRMSRTDLEKKFKRIV